MESNWAKVMRSVTVNDSCIAGQNGIAECAKALNRGRVESLVDGDANRQPIRPPDCTESPRSRENRLDIQPVCAIVRDVVHDQDHRHWLAEPSSQIRSLDPERDKLPHSHNAQMLCCLCLNQDVTAFGRSVVGISQ